MLGIFEIFQKDRHYWSAPTSRLTVETCRVRVSRSLRIHRVFLPVKVKSRVQISVGSAESSDDGSFWCIGRPAGAWYDTQYFGNRRLSRRVGDDTIKMAEAPRLVDARTRSLRCHTGIISRVANLRSRDVSARQAESSSPLFVRFDRIGAGGTSPFESTRKMSESGRVSGRCRHLAWRRRVRSVAGPGVRVEVSKKGPRIRMRGEPTR